MHLEILQQLSNRNQQLSAYQLGRALSDMCWLPDEKVPPDQPRGGASASR